MPRHCSAGGCKSRDNRETRKAGITFHKLPKGATRRNLWITNSHRVGLWDPQTDFVYFCSKHFTPESFELTGYSGIRRLREDAFPSVFEPIQDPKSKRTGRPRKREGIQVRKKPQPLKAEAATKDAFQEQTEEAESKRGEDVCVSVPKGKHDQVASDIEDLLQQDSHQLPPANLQSPPVPRPLSPSHYMRRLPPPPGFYLGKEHSYAQLCPLLWRRRYDRVIDCLEKALRQLNAARRRESRLRSALLQLREKHLKQVMFLSKDGCKSNGSWMPGAETGRCRASRHRGGRGFYLANKDERELDEETEDTGLYDNRTGEEVDRGGHLTQTDTNHRPEEERGYCLYCGRGGEDKRGQVICRISETRKAGQLTMHGVSLRCQVNERVEEFDKHLREQLNDKEKEVLAGRAEASKGGSENYHCYADVTDDVKGLQLMRLERPLGTCVDTAPNFHRGTTPPVPQALLQIQVQSGLNPMTSAEVLQRDNHAQSLSSDLGSQQGVLLTDLCARESEHAGPEDHGGLERHEFRIEETNEGELCLVSVPTEDELESIIWMQRVAEDSQNMLVSEVGHQRDFGQMTGDNGRQRLENIPREARVENASSYGNGGQQSILYKPVVVMKEDVRQKLKEHLEGFHLQLSNEFAS
ncbi:THAP domain-containing protein 7 [Lampris incognitus]|uniref:THAP domain-containing protein 7 n=1 Tax=Lampris incognitus TaxID=2546036 RepID=UPI0024B5DD9E|nr:THAP domain-containing protein 7 [Lampris incognitus]